METIIKNLINRVAALEEELSERLDARIEKYLDDKFKELVEEVSFHLEHRREPE